MAISGIGQNYYQNNVTTKKKYKEHKRNRRNKQYAGGNRSGGNGGIQKEFYAELERIPKNSTIVNLAINISEEAFENMKADPEYRAKIMSALQRDLTSSFAPLKASLLLTVGATEKDYRGDSWSGPNNDSEFLRVRRIAFIRKQADRKIIRKNFWKNIWKSGRRRKNSSRKC